MNPMRPKAVNQTLQQRTLAHRVRAQELAPKARRAGCPSLHRDAEKGSFRKPVSSFANRYALRAGQRAGRCRFCDFLHPQIRSLKASLADVIVIGTEFE